MHILPASIPHTFLGPTIRYVPEAPASKVARPHVDIRVASCGVVFKV